MTFRGYLLFMLFSTFLALGAWLSILLTIDPRQAGSVEFVFFYVTLFFSLAGLFTLIGSCLRVWVLRRRGVITREVNIAFRHAMLLSLVAVLSLLLLNQNVFHWWVLLLLIGAAGCVEYLVLKFSLSARQ